ncbi:MAG: DUF2946 family protein [Xanthobacteraceae bacterium]
MRGLRKFIRDQKTGSFLAVCVAYSLAIQALMASVGLGMSAASASGQVGFVICSFAHAPAIQSPTTPNDKQAPDSQLQCPFCFVAAQSAGHVAALADAPAFSAYTGSLLAGTLGDAGDVSFVPVFHRTLGDPRAPPFISV